MTTLEDLKKAVEESCKRALRVFRNHKEETKPDETHLQSMKFFRDNAHGKIAGMIDLYIVMAAKEYYGNNAEYWERVNQIREFEDVCNNELSDIFGDWYTDYISTTDICRSGNEE